MPHIPSRHLAEGPRVGIRHFTYEDGAEFTARARESKDLHHPWLFPPDSAQAYEAYAGRLIEDRTKAGFLVCEKDPDPASGDAPGSSIAGFVNINNIVEGGFLSGALGYGAFAHAAGRGLMREGLDLVVRYAFGPMRLHRLEINVQPGNAASIALARSCGFHLEGFSPRMLYLDGAWRDHQRWAITAETVTSG
ncbi:GNAT family protein [Streptomyces sp. NPDC005395]|jgi:ribosomal-protein-alanine N-acetyltransferase|uniref:GNAT family N-acetyltransferase n=1 Tax=Streptomyces salinarius TaxID=2762598 RepID=A0ABW8B4G8_9ACTN|nr:MULTISPECIES: GNAT family protein [Streptomyces]WSU00246.1 GNAT family N-acetyltransferase [Streptomyces sp. NBC_01124]AZM74540.1 N-acetyltransferase [Streptomyces sp. KPB2]MBH5129983.1 GNAT family N-acetyltransferase [Streptomyces sp. HB-N217]MCV2459828.1 GNAT family N-acetyltransferase [Streptomyces sp. ICN988]MDU0257306.1 GNAT family protein [Streptomyces sp. PU10]